MPAGALMLKPVRNIPRAEAVAAIVSLALASALLLVKLGAYWITGSSAIFSDAMETVVNVVSSAFAIYALSVAHTPADANHPYGHGKIEFVSAGLEGLLILLASAIVFMRTLDTLMFRQVRLDHPLFGMSMLAASVIGNGLAGWYLQSLGRRFQSPTLEGDGKHLSADAWTSVAAAIALSLVLLSGWVYIDTIAAGLIAIYLAWVGCRLVGRAGGGLMDRQDLEDERLIQSILDAHLGAEGRAPAICSYHKLRHRHSGRYHWVDFHIRVYPAMSVGQGHNVASAIEHEIEQALGEGNATAHIEPCGQPDCSCCHPTPPTPAPVLSGTHPES